MSDRPTWDDYFGNIAVAVSARGDCTRRRVGAVIVKDNRIVATGYNGAEAGGPSCLKGECPRGKHYRVKCRCPGGSRTHAVECACGQMLPCPEASTPGSDYSNCIAIHAEANAILYADRDKTEGATIYITEEPCADCAKLIRGSGIERIVVNG